MGIPNDILIIVGLAIALGVLPDGGLRPALSQSRAA